MNQVLWGTLTAFSWGAADFAARFSSRAIGHANSLLGMLVVGSVVLTLWVAFTGTPLVWTWSGLWLLGVTGVGVMAATLLLYNGLARGPVTVVAPIVGSYPALVVAIALILGSRPSPVQWAAMAAVMAGVMVVARFAPPPDGTGRDGHLAPGGMRRTVAIALASSACFALAISAGQAAAPIYGEVQTVWVSRLISLASLAVLFLVKGEAPSLPRRWWAVLAAQGFCDSGAYLALFAGSQGPGAEITAVAASGFGAVTVLLARIFLSEAMSRPQWAGIAVIFAGVAVLAGQS